jgi:DNA mismatch repair protein MutL
MRYNRPMPGMAAEPTAQGREIRPLPALLVNQIAAGEVVERPASVVKELVENALDAGASRVSLELEQGGIELVRVSDDGAGIGASQLPLAIAPHATSKIRESGDLDRIGTLGFRGEALASIASVSRLQVRSRTAAEPGASLLEAEGETVGQVRPAAGPVGTAVAVRNLFFNTPARRKFLRTPQTEQGRCLDALRELAMAHPAVGFAASCDGRAMLDLPPGQTPRERALAILGRELEGQLVEVQADEFDDSRGVTIWGLAGLPAVARGTNAAQHIFLNGRVIRDKTVQHAVREAYRGLIEPGRYPTCVLMMEMDPGAVDVNVHPAKVEVRFRDPSLVHSVVLRSVREALRRADLTPTVGTVLGGGYGQGRAILPPEGGASGAGEGGGEGGVSRFVDFFRRRAPAPGGGLSYQEIRQAVADIPPAAPAGGVDSRAQAGMEAELAAPEPASRVLQVHNSYLITQDDQGVLIVDQHALHERVMFEALFERVRSSPLESQRLLAPAVVPATERQVERLGELAPLLGRIGVEAAALGPRTVGVGGFPSFLFERGVDPVEFVGELLERSESEEFAPGSEQALHEVLDMMACKAAVKAGDHMSDTELSELLRLRDAVERSSNCPHGRPTTVRLTIRELEKLFRRA